MITTPIKQWRRQKETASLIGKTGKILHWTMIRVPSKSFTREAPYPVVIVELEDKTRMIGQLVDWEQNDLVSHRKVIAVLRKLPNENPESIISYHIKFKPIPVASLSFMFTGLDYDLYRAEEVDKKSLVYIQDALRQVRKKR